MSGNIFNRLFDVGQRNEKPTGEYRLVRELEKAAGSKQDIEEGFLKIIDPKGKIIYREPYVAGGIGNGAPPFKKAELSNSILPTTLEGGYITVDALRLADEDMGGRTGILIHKDVGKIGSGGCICPSEEDMQKFIEIWNNIPARQRPDEIEVQNTKGKYLSDLGKNLSEKGFDLAENHAAQKPTDIGADITSQPYLS